MNAKTSLLLTSLLALGISGCSWISPIEIFSSPIERTNLQINEPSQLKPKLVKWFIITPENMEQVFKDLEKKKYNLVLFGLTDDGYENLSMNIAEVRKYILEQKAIIKAYKEYYETN